VDSSKPSSTPLIEVIPSSPTGSDDSTKTIRLGSSLLTTPNYPSSFVKQVAIEAAIDEGSIKEA